MESLRDKVAIVTGGTSGIGRATATALAGCGSRVVVVGRDAARVDDAVSAIRDAAGNVASCAVGLALDVRSAADMDEMARRTLEAFGRIDILVAAAGTGGSLVKERRIPFAVVQTPTAEWEEIIDTNLKGMFLSIRAVLPAMMGRGFGEIVNLSSARGATRGTPYAAGYCASKHGVMGLSEALAEEARSYGVRVQVVLPDATETLMLRVTGDLAPRGSMSPAQVADFIVHLLQLPRDAMMIDPLIAPFAPLGRAG